MRDALLTTVLCITAFVGIILLGFFSGEDERKQAKGPSALQGGQGAQKK